MAVVIEPRKMSSDLARYSDALVVGDKNLDSILETIEPLVQAAYSSMSDYLAEAEAQRSAIAAKKDEILAERRRQALLGTNNETLDV